MNGKYGMHHNSGTWNGIWSDMYIIIETIFIRYGYTAGGLTYYIILEPSAVARWALSYYVETLQPRRSVAKTNLSHTTMTSLMSGNKREQLIERKYGRH